MLGSSQNSKSFKQVYNNYQNKSNKEIFFDEFELFNVSFEEKQMRTHHKFEDFSKDTEDFDNFFEAPSSKEDLQRQLLKLKSIKLDNKRQQKRKNNIFRPDKIGSFNDFEEEMGRKSLPKFEVPLQANRGFNNSKFLFSNFSKSRERIPESNLTQTQTSLTPVLKSKKKKFLFKYKEDSFMFTQSQSQRMPKNEDSAHMESKKREKSKYLFSGNKNHVFLKNKNMSFENELNK